MMPRLALLGESGVGKTTFALSWARGVPTPAPRPTLGIEPVDTGDGWQVWDVAGDATVSPAFRQTTTRDAAILVLCYRDGPSLVALQRRWYAHVTAECRARRAAVPVVVVAFADDERSTDPAAVAWARSIGARAHLSVNIYSSPSIERARDCFAIINCATRSPACGTRSPDAGAGGP